MVTTQVDPNRLYFDEASTVTDADMKQVSKLMDKANYRKHRSMFFWRIIGCRLFGHKANAKKTHMTVAPGLYCARCFSWVNTAAKKSRKEA